MTMQCSRSVVRPLPLIAVVALAASASGQEWAELHEMVPRHTGLSSVVRFADLDGDGDLDLIRDRPAPGLFFNDGFGHFAPRASISDIGVASESVQLGDVDGDGDVDAVRYDHLFGVLLNDGTGAFQPSTLPFPVTLSGRDADLADYDGDGDLDFFLGAWNSPNGELGDRLLLNDGNGAFTDAATQPPDMLVGTHDVASGDFDGDGDLDVLTAETRRARLYLNDGAAVFTDATKSLPYEAASFAVQLGDLDADGDVDAVMSDALGVRRWINAGNAFFADAGPAFDSYPVRLRLVDLDGDSDLDLFRFGSTLEVVFLNDGLGAFTDATAVWVPPGGYGAQAAFGDVDKDGDVDVHVADDQRVTGLWLNDRNTRLFDPPHDIDTGVDFIGMRDLQSSDLDMDGDLDLVFRTNSSVNVAWLHNGGSSKFEMAWPGFDLDNVQRVRLIDIDGDGDDDVFVAQTGSPSGVLDVLLKNTGSGFLDVTGQLPPVLDRSSDCDVGDIDGDGDIDLFIGNEAGPPQLYVNGATGVFTASMQPLTQTSVALRVVRLVDADGDGDLDAYGAGLQGGAPPWAAPQFLWLNDSSGNFALSSGAMPWSGLASNVRQADFVDVDGDADLDLVTANYPGGFLSKPITLFLNQGSGTFVDASTQLSVQPSGFDTVPLYCIDIDTDGDVDLVTRDSHAYVNDGSANFIYVSKLVAAVSWLAFIGDLDRDGDPEMLEDHGNLYSGLTRHIAWRGLPRVGKPLVMDVWGPADGHFVLAVSRGVAANPFQPVGWLAIDRARVVQIEKGALDAEGHASVRFDIENRPELIGTTLYWQALVGRPARLTNLEMTTFTGL